jgi:hypothetical protein
LVAVISSALVPLCVYLQTRKGQATGITFIDATSRVVCHSRRLHHHQVFKKIVPRGNTSGGWRALIETINGQLKNLSQIEPPTLAA